MVCGVAHCRAQKLIAGLGGEKSRWTAAAERLGREYVQLTGDVLLAAAQIAYLGAFTSTYRHECLNGWVKACTAKGVPCSEKFKLAAVLGDPVKVHECITHVPLAGADTCISAYAVSPACRMESVLAAAAAMHSLH